MSEIFRIDCEVVLENRVDVLPSLGKPVAITVYEQERPVRYFHSLLIEAHYVQQDDEGFRYILVLRPWLYLLGHNRDYRIFEQKTVIQIMKVVLAKYSRSIDYGKLTQTYRPWPYCTQYRESDLAFVMRLMEREGIYFYFRHEQGEHVMVLADSRSAHKPAPQFATVKLRPDLVGEHGYEDALWEWQEHVRSGGERQFLLQSFDYEKTKIQDGKVDGGARNPADTQEVYQFTGDFVDVALAKHWAQVRLEAARANQRFYTGAGDPIGIACGGLFTLDSTDAFDRGREFIVTTLDYSMDAEPYRSASPMARRHIAIEAVTSDTKWRAPQVTPASIAGPETAVVLEGGADDSRADYMGRVRVKFLWNKPGDAPSKARSCWLRVSHPSAGASFGHVTLPRIDEEVIVDFLDGNPDRPIVTGRVYNSQHKHAYTQPAHRTRSLYRSHTIGRTGSYVGAESTPRAPSYNELSFEDKGGAEEVYMRAQRNRRSEVLLDDDEKVLRDQTRRVGRDRRTAIRRNETQTVETGNRSLKVRRGFSRLEAFRQIFLKVMSSRFLMTRTSITAQVMGSKIQMTPTTVSIRTGPSSIVLSPAGIRMMVGPTNLINISEAGILVKGLTLTEKADTAFIMSGAVTTVRGEPLNIGAPFILG